MELNVQISEQEALALSHVDTLQFVVVQEVIEEATAENNAEKVYYLWGEEKFSTLEEVQRTLETRKSYMYNEDAVRYIMNCLKVYPTVHLLEGERIDKLFVRSRCVPQAYFLTTTEAEQYISQLNSPPALKIHVVPVVEGGYTFGLLNILKRLGDTLPQ